MKAVELTGVSRLEVCSRELAPLDEHSVLLKVEAVGVCGSDLRIYRNGDPRVSFPRIMGHEIAGTIADKGKEVRGFEIGDRVALGAHIPCGVCRYCIEGQGQHCVKGWTIGYQFDGGFAEYVVLNREMMLNGSVCELEDHTPFDEACLAEPLSCVMNGLKRLSVRPGETVVVFGVGAIGGMFISLLKKMGAGKIIAVQRSEERRKLAWKLGADICIDPAQNSVTETILEHTGGYGCDVSIVTVPSNEVQNQTLTAMRKQGRVLFFAGLPKHLTTELNTNSIVYKELSLLGVHGASRLDHQDAVKWINRKFIDMSPFITHRYSLEDTEKAFAATEQKLGLKSVVLPSRKP
ncbi:L-threonine 3-dehydrogenase [Paenibacillus darwinianus]|uniref:L-threonine 3-dehydrogenase n=1 Tax=Paenibacillus darwinianus TaxID=1380763 RepID=A0A9W5RYQ1_9BACL|nr:alcohol dehydrogenase catalytic domain-containing protein [Paenibacillus darwinianus]EXX84712.1 L-threonine 3-dehydrogenase [Paenibacillus darwinianus]EXX84772.1 L-threonine 3-dehydrogenase [Paenibacillus darwinianus]EXX84827.1 L-threonine 3-dehydrogenase [Paenibacillus darwinianus]